MCFLPWKYISIIYGMFINTNIRNKIFASEINQVSTFSVLKQRIQMMQPKQTKFFEIYNTVFSQPIKNCDWNIISVIHSLFEKLYRKVGQLNYHFLRNRTILNSYMKIYSHYRISESHLYKGRKSTSMIVGWILKGTFQLNQNLKCKIILRLYEKLVNFISFYWALVELLTIF